MKTKLKKKKRVMFPNSSGKKSKNVREKKQVIDKKRITTGDKFLYSALGSNEKKNGKIVSEGINHNVNFNPDMMFENLVDNYRLAKQLYGETLIRKVTGYDEGFLEKNLVLPEFRRKLKKELKDKINDLKKQELIDNQGNITDKGYELSSIIMYTEELDNLKAKGFGEKEHKKISVHGEKAQVRNFKSGDPYKNIDLRKTIRLAVRRRHKRINKKDLKTSLKKSKGRINIVYAIDSSASMNGKKIEMAKKAGIALSYIAVNNKDRIGLVIFRTETIEKIPPTDDFEYIIQKIGRIRARKETNLTNAVKDSIDIFPETNSTKHLVLITDAMPTIGKDPEKETIEAVLAAKNHKITISLVGIGLNKKGTELAKKITEIGKGRLFLVKDIENLDAIVLKDYYGLSV
ncbi:VWA domain-containing protein [Candidatus Woesearchaeota archaeon]|nr:VWA domain-containing protein [Candidatus Woesearchaeota archaeon]